MLVQFVRQSLQELETMPDRLLAIVCDGSNGRSASLLGVSDEFFNISCKTYGAMADIERLHLPPHPQPSPSVTTLRHLQKSTMVQQRRGSVVAQHSNIKISNITSRGTTCSTLYDADVEGTDSPCQEMLEEQQETTDSSNTSRTDANYTTNRYS